MRLRERARAKINLVLRVRGRRADGFHELESLVAFAGACDYLGFEPAEDWSLDVTGSEAPSISGPDNLVLGAARAMVRRWPALQPGRFTLDKHLPVASGIGGGSADAAAAIRILARTSGIAPDDPGLLEVAGEIGSDVPVCVESRSRVFRGRGEVLEPVLDLPPIACVLVNPRIAVATADVFSALGLAPGEPRSGAATGDLLPGRTATAVIGWLAEQGNDLEEPALDICPVIGDVLHRLRAVPGCRLARMSGSGATAFGLFDSRHEAAAAARLLARENPGWWVHPTIVR